MSKIILPVAAMAVALSAVASAAGAHEVWVERHNPGAARVYLGEPAEPVPAAGDPEFPKLTAPKVFTGDPSKPAVLTRKANHIEAAVGPGDVRVQDSAIFKPWKTSDGLTAGIFYGRAGREETRTLLPLEIAPVTAGGDTFVVVFRGRPAPGATVTVVNPERWTKTFAADDAGRVAIPVQASGRYLLGVTYSEKGAATVEGEAVAKVVHISTLTFNQP